MRIPPVPLLFLLGLAAYLRGEGPQLHRIRPWRRGADSWILHDVGRPEPYLFLDKAGREMKVYHDQYQAYPSTWEQSDMFFIWHPDRADDPNGRPGPNQGKEWRPRWCRFVYVIREATKDRYLVQAVDESGLPEWEMDQDMVRPQKVARPPPPLFMRAVRPADGYDQGDDRIRRFGKDPSLSLAATLAATGGELVLSYEVKNSGPRDVYLLNIVVPRYSYDGDPDAIYAHLQRRTKIVWLNKRIPAIPVDFDPYAPAFPDLTALRAGKTFREEVHVPLPVEEFQAYAMSFAPRTPVAPVLYDGVRFTLQYYWRTEGMTEDTRRIRKPLLRFGLGKGVFEEPDEFLSVLVTHGGAPLTDADHGFLETEVVPLRVPVVELP